MEPLDQSDEELPIVSAKKKKLMISSSSSDDDVCSPYLKTPKNRSNSVETDKKRSSERIKKRRNRTFSLPSKADRWKDIPSEKYSEKELQNLTPKKLINNYTKENHRYNYDPVYTSGEESIEEFINDESESESSDSDSKKPSKKKKHQKVRNFHHRIAKESSSDSDSNRNKRFSDSDSDVVRNSTRRKSKCIDSESDDENRERNKACRNLDEEFENKLEGYEDSDSDIAVGDRSRACIIDSDRDCNDSETTREGAEVDSQETNKNVNGTGPENASSAVRIDVGADIMGNCNQDNLNETNNEMNPAHEAENTTDEESCSSENESSSSDSEIEIKSDRTRVMMAKKNKKKVKLFDKFRAAREQKMEREAKRRQSETGEKEKDTAG